MAEAGVVRVDHTTLSGSENLNKSSSHDESSQRRNANKVFGFDLLLEWQRIHERTIEDDRTREETQQRFITNAETYINEALHVGVAKYDPYFITEQNGVVTLTAKGYDGPVREMFNPDSNDPRIKWPEYRKNGYNYVRARLEYEVFSQFEQSLKDAKVGDNFVWISPPCLEIVLSDLPEEQKEHALEELGFGFHSNVFVLTKESDKILQGRVIQNYLGSEGHRKLLKELLNQDLFDHEPTELELLGIIAKIPKKDITVADIKNKIEQIYRDTPDSKKIKPTKDYEKDGWEDEQRMKIIHATTRPLLEQIYYLLHHVDESDISHQDIRELIENRVHGWEAVIKLLKEGKPVDIGHWENLTPYQLEELAVSQIETIKMRRHIMQTQGGLNYDHVVFADNKYARHHQDLDGYTTLYSRTKSNEYSTGCGIGSGFGLDDKFSATPKALRKAPPLGGHAAAALPTTYWGAERLMNNSTEKDILCCKCPECETEVEAEIQRSPDSPTGKIIYCPNCKATASW